MTTDPPQPQPPFTSFIFQPSLQATALIHLSYHRWEKVHPVKNRNELLLSCFQFLIEIEKKWKYIRCPSLDTLTVSITAALFLSLEIKRG